MAIAVLMAGVQGVLIPLVQDLGSREVDERLLAPIGVLGVSVGRIVAGAVHAAAAGLVAGPAMILLMHGVGLGDVRPQWTLLLPLVALCGLVSGAFGLTLDARPAPLQRAPLRGGARADDALWLRLLPLGPARGAGPAPAPLPAEPPHLHEARPCVSRSPPRRPTVPLLIAGLLGYLALFTALGARSFEKRTIL